MLNLFLKEFALFWKTKIILMLLVLILGLTAYGFISSYQYLAHTVAEVDAIRSHLEQEQLKTGVDWDIDLSDLEQYVLSGLSTFHPNNGYKYALAVLATIGPIMFGVAGAIFIGTEFSNRTAKVKVSHFGWSKTIMAKFLVLFVSILAATALAFLIGILASQIGWKIITSQEVYNNYIITADFSLNCQMALTPITGIGFYTFFAFFAALVSKKSTVGVISVFVVPFTEQLLPVSFIPQKLHLYLLNNTYPYFAGWIVSPSHLTTHVSTPIAGFCLLIGWLCLMVFASYIVSKVQRN